MGVAYCYRMLYIAHLIFLIGYSQQQAVTYLKGSFICPERQTLLRFRVNRLQTVGSGWKGGFGRGDLQRCAPLCLNTAHCVPFSHHLCCSETYIANLELSFATHTAACPAQHSEPLQCIELDNLGVLFTNGRLFKMPVMMLVQCLPVAKCIACSVMNS